VAPRGSSIRSSTTAASPAGIAGDGRWISRRRRSGRNTSMCASISVSRSTLARNEPPSRGDTLALLDSQRASRPLSVSAAQTRAASASTSMRRAYPRVFSAMPALCHRVMLRAVATPPRSAGD
jgi:hypothetical protein